MNESAVPPPEPSPDSQLRPPKKFNWHELLWALAVAVAVVVVVGGLWLVGRDKSAHTSLGSPHLVIDNHDSSKLYLTDGGGKQLYESNYPNYSYINFEASSPKGKVLVSNGIATSSESFSLISGNRSSALSKDATAQLSQAIVLDNSHRSFFTDENTLVYVSCPAAKTCRLMGLDLTSGKANQVVDLGIKQAISSLPPAYVLGVSPDGKTVYVRTLDSNKLGAKSAAVYAVDLSGKVTGSWDVPRLADYTPALSPDAKQLVYKESGAFDAKNPSVSIVVLSLSSSKTSTAKLTGGDLPDTPNSLAWSPDSKKVLMAASGALLLGQKPSSSDIQLSYLDTTKNQLSKIATVKDTSMHQVNYSAWLDNSTAVYNELSSTKPNDFSAATYQVVKQPLSGQSSAIKAPAGALKQVIFY